MATAVAGALTAVRQKSGGLLNASVLIGPATFIVSGSLLPPLLLLARYSLNRYDQRVFMVDALTGENYARFVVDPFYASVLLTTITIAVVTTALTIIIGMPIAYKLARSTSQWKPIGVLLIVIPLFVGSTVRALGWMALLSRGGIVDSIDHLLFGGNGLSLLYTPFAVCIGIISINLPYMVLTLQSVIENIDTCLEEAADGLGASPYRRFRHVVLPLSLPGVVTGGILALILAMNAYATPTLLGGVRFKMMAPALYQEFAINNNWPFAAALAFILMIATLVLTGLSKLALEPSH